MRCLARPASAYFIRRAPSRRWESTTAESASNPKIASIVDQIGQLTLLETADLVSNLKASLFALLQFFFLQNRTSCSAYEGVLTLIAFQTRLNIPDLPVGSFAAAPPPGSPAAAPAAEEDDSPPAAQEKTLFTITLKSFETGAKPKIIKEIKSMLGLSLVDSKKFVESAPKTMKEGVPKEEAEKIIESMKALGGVVSMD